MDGLKEKSTPKNPTAKKENIHTGHRRRLREKFLLYGADAFHDHELLELLLFYAKPRVDTNHIAHKLLNQFGSLQRVFAAPISEIAKVEGLGESSALLIAMIAPLYRRAMISEMKDEVILDTIERLGAYFTKLFVAEKFEVMYQLCLDAKGRKLKLYKINEGCPAGVGFNMREIVSNALVSNAAMVVLAHNHPSGVALPSPADETGTIQVREALEAISVTLADHIIVADNDYVSFRESHLL